MEFNKGKEKANKESEYLSDWEDKETWKWGFEDGYTQAIEDSKAPEMFEMLRELLYKISEEYSKEKDEIEQLLTKITQ